jgi:hypothetical protein
MFSGNKKRVKHFLKQVHFLLDNVRRSVIKMEWLQGQDMPADTLSKPLSARDHAKHTRSLLGPQKRLKVNFATQVIDSKVNMDFGMLNIWNND